MGLAKLDDLKNTVQNTNLDDVKNRVQEKISNINVDEIKNNVRQQASRIRSEVTDRFNRLPKPIDPRTHAVLDYLVTGYFLCTAGLFWGRNRRAAGLALTNAAMVLGVSMLTDYTGRRMGANIRPLLSFKQHRSADIMQAGCAALGPTLLGFGDDWAALPFRLQAGNEAMVVSLTDWEAGGQGELNVGDIKDKIRDIAA
jgi:hypothetical protein